MKLFQIVWSGSDMPGGDGVAGEGSAAGEVSIVSVDGIMTESLEPSGLLGESTSCLFSSTHE